MHIWDFISVYRNTSDNIKNKDCFNRVKWWKTTHSFSLKSTCGQRNACIFFGFVCLIYGYSVFCYYEYIWFSARHNSAILYRICFCPLQPAIVLTPINCTQTAAPQIEGPLTKPESQTTEAPNQSGDSPRQPLQETPPAEKDEGENKSDWKDVYYSN